jgi:hypothetical protein
VCQIKCSIPVRAPWSRCQPHHDPVSHKITQASLSRASLERLINEETRTTGLTVIITMDNSVWSNDAFQNSDLPVRAPWSRCQPHHDPVSHKITQASLSRAPLERLINEETRTTGLIVIITMDNSVWSNDAFQNSDLPVRAPWSRCQPHHDPVSQAPL